MKVSAAILTAALTAAASAAAVEQLEKKQAPTTPFNTQSAFLVLATALPSSVLTQAVADPSAFSSEVASEFAHSMTPGWFSSLPTDIKTYLLMQSTATSAGSVPTSLPTSARPSATGMMPYGTNGTGVGSMGTGSSGPTAVTVTSQDYTTTTMGGSRSSTSGSGSSSSGTAGASSSGSASQASASSASSRSSSALAVVPTAAFGAGLGAALGVVGMLAL